VTMKLPFVQNNIDMSSSPWSTSRSKLCLDDHTRTSVVNFSMKIIDRWWVFLYKKKKKTIILLLILLVLLWSTPCSSVWRNQESDWSTTWLYCHMIRASTISLTEILLNSFFLHLCFSGSLLFYTVIEFWP